MCYSGCRYEDCWGECRGASFQGKPGAHCEEEAETRQGDDLREEENTERIAGEQQDCKPEEGL